MEQSNYEQSRPQNNPAQNPANDPSRYPAKDINISYETLFELLRLEKNRDDLQQLHNTFFEDSIAYLKEKKQILDESMVKADLFSATEREKTSNEISNIKKILKELYERREKKIISMALNKSRTSSSIIDTSRLLEEEKRFFDHIVGIMDHFRHGILFNVLEMRQPYVVMDTASSSEQKKQDNQPVQKDTKLVRFLSPVPKFVGKELEHYGPFEEEDMATLPSDIADLLISKSRAEEITES